MVLSDKSLALLKQIYAHRGRGEEQFVDEDASEALEYVLQRITDTLSDRWRNGAPLDVVMREAVASLNLDRQERRTAEAS